MLATFLISTNKNRQQVKVPFATKKVCLENFLDVFKNERIFIFADGDQPGKEFATNLARELPVTVIQ